MNTIDINSISRTFILRLPPAYDGHTKLPLVMLLHGAMDSAVYAEEAYRFVEKSTAGRFILVIPDALGDNHAWRPFDPAPNNDLTFLTTLLETLPQDHAIDPERIYVCGHSAGAIMTYRLAAERPYLIAAAGIVAGTVGNTFDSSPTTIPIPKAPVPLILFHGRRDTTLPYDGATPGIFSVKESIAFWSKINQTPSAPTRIEAFTPTVHRNTYISPIHADIVLYTLAEGNHMWPGGKPMPNKSEKPLQDISATGLIWDFFQSHPRSTHIPPTAITQPGIQ